MDFSCSLQRIAKTRLEAYVELVVAITHDLKTAQTYRVFPASLRE
jgi:hypothetical protein